MHLICTHIDIETADAFVHARVYADAPDDNQKLFLRPCEI